MNNFLEQLHKIDKRYQLQQEKKKGFNIFSAMYRGHEEEELHSRFISYLLSPESKHGMKSEFLKLFVRNVLNLKDDFPVDNNCKVYPNEKDKSEERNIDILIFNKEKTKAIIIENKIWANDSNDDNVKNTDPKYDGQLERYYHTIKGKDKSGNIVIIDNFKIECESVKVFYLTMYKHKPDEKSYDSIPSEDFSLEHSIIRYYEIQEWLKSCIDNTNDTIVKEIIRQYLDFLIKMTNDDKIVLNLIDLINNQQDYWKQAYDLRDQYECLKENNRRHIAWHITDRFFNELKEKLEENSYKIIDFPDNEKITRTTHKNKKGITDSLVIRFKKIGVENEFYIANDLNGITYKKIGDQSNYKIFSAKIKFHDFTVEETFKLINGKEREDVLKKLIHEFQCDIDPNYRWRKDLDYRWNNGGKEMHEKIQNDPEFMQSFEYQEYLDSLE